MKRSVFFIALLAAGGCAAESHPCQDDRGPGSCVEVELQGAVSPLDDLQLRVETSFFIRPATSLPAVMALLLPPGRSDLTVDAAALRQGGTRGTGRAQTAVSDGRHVHLIVPLVPSGGGCSDGFWDVAESDVDCGVNCNACAVNARCNQNGDCDTAICTASHCASAPPPVMVTPASASVAAGGHKLFSADVPVSWSVEEGAAGGRIDPSGLYTAPASPGTFHVHAESQPDASRSGRATVMVVP